MNRVPPLVDERRDVVIDAVIVQEQIRMEVIDGAIHVRARGLAGLRIHMHPVAVQTRGQHLEIVGPQRPSRRERERLRFVQVERPVGCHKRRIDVVVREVIQAEHPSSQLEIAVQGRKMPVRGFYQRLIDVDRDVWPR